MVKIVCKPGIVSKLPPTLVARAIKALEGKIAQKELRARKKWQEIILVDGHRIALGCHKVGDIVEVSAAHKMTAKKKRRK